jgi:hypothetical protein
MNEIYFCDNCGHWSDYCKCMEEEECICENEFNIDCKYCNQLGMGEEE